MDFGLFVPRGDAERIFASRDVFTREEFATSWVAAGHSPASADSVLNYYDGTGRILRVRRGLYITAESRIDPFVIASKLAPGAVIAYSGALAFHRLHGVGHSMAVAAPKRARPFTLNEVCYRTVPHPLPAGRELEHTEEHEHEGIKLRVTTPARTLVDCMHRLERGPGFLSTFRAFASHPDFHVNLREIAAYAFLLGSKVAAARTAACLWGHPKWHSLSYDQQCALAALAGRNTVYAVPPPLEEPQYLARIRVIVPGAFMSIVHSPETIDWRPPGDADYQ